MSTFAITGYLKSFNADQVKHVINEPNEPVYSRMLEFGVPVPFFTVESGSKAYIRMFYTFGADIQTRTTDGNIGVLAHTVLQARVDLRDTTELIRLRITHGADPAQIQTSLWEDYIKRAPCPIMNATTPRLDIL